MFSQTNEYALRVVTFLGAFGKKPVKNADISKATQVPAGYLYKVLQTLVRAGLVTGQRGINGGFTLNRDPADISVFDVVQAVDPLPRIRSCPLHLRSHGINLCPLHKRLDQALEMVEKAFRASSIAELLSDPNPSVLLCDADPGKGKARTTLAVLKSR